MAETGRFVASVDYTQAQFAEVLNRFLGIGVLAGVGNHLIVSASSPVAMSVVVATGEAAGKGYWYQNDAAKTLTITASDPTNPRIDRVMVRFNLASATPPALAVLAGTPAASPSAPALTQNASTWEISLAQVRVEAAAASIASSKITDERYKPSVCGIVVPSHPHPSLANLLVNGSFLNWQRGTSFTADNVYTADRWVQDWGAGSSGTTTRVNTNLPEQVDYACQIAYTHSAASSFNEQIEDYLALRGRPVTFSALVKATAASAVTLQIYDGTTLTQSAYHSGSGNWEWLTVTATPGAATTALLVGHRLEASATISIAAAMLTPTPWPEPYVPMHPADDLARCQRYYELHGGVATSNPTFQATATSGHVEGITIGFHSSKYGTPTMTKNGTWTASNCGQPAAAQANSDGYLFWVTASATGNFAVYPDSTDDTITAESNP